MTAIMNEIEKSIHNQMWIYAASLKTMLWLKIQDKYAPQFEVTIDNLRTSAIMLRVERVSVSLMKSNVSKCQGVKMVFNLFV